MARKDHIEKRLKALYMYGELCACCGKTLEDGIKLQADHIFPQISFPQHKYKFANYQILCHSCNVGKGAEFIKDYRYEEKNWKTYSEETKKYLTKIKPVIESWWRKHFKPPTPKQKKTRLDKNKRGAFEAGSIVKPKWIK